MNKSIPVTKTQNNPPTWYLIFIIAYGIWVLAPFLTPVFMRLGWDSAAKVIYSIYSFFCHQLPERSYFFFGPKTSYSLSEIQTVWENTANPMILRKFIGTPEMGWKVAWSDRMISFYGGTWLSALIWYPLRNRTKSLHPLWTGVFLTPIAVDGFTHMVSDFAGIGLGFRDSNLWLANLTNFAYAQSFYAGDALGSFNSWMRIITGLIAGVGIIWFAFPFMHQAYSAQSSAPLGKSNKSASKTISERKPYV